MEIRIKFSKFLITGFVMILYNGKISEGIPYYVDDEDYANTVNPIDDNDGNDHENDEDDTNKLNSVDDNGIQCPHRDGGNSPKPNFAEWEFYSNPPGNNDQSNSSRTGGITYLDMEDDGPQTPPYDTEDMRVTEPEPKEDTEYLQSEWRQNWTRKTAEERFEEVLQHAKRSTLVNWYQYGLEEWKELEELKKCVAEKKCDPSKLHEPIEVAEVRMNKALRTLAKYIAKFEYGEATGEKTM